MSLHGLRLHGLTQSATVARLGCYDKPNCPKCCTMVCVQWHHRMQLYCKKTAGMPAMYTISKRHICQCCWPRGQLGCSYRNSVTHSAAAAGSLPSMRVPSLALSVLSDGHRQEAVHEAPNPALPWCEVCYWL